MIPKVRHRRKKNCESLCDIKSFERSIYIKKKLYLGFRYNCGKCRRNFIKSDFEVSRENSNKPQI